MLKQATNCAHNAVFMARDSCSLAKEEMEKAEKKEMPGSFLMLEIWRVQVVSRTHAEELHHVSEMVAEPLSQGIVGHRAHLIYL